MSDNRYNGWSNYETWCVKLWMDNDQGSQEYWSESAQDTYRRYEDDKDGAIDVLAESIEAQYDEDFDSLIPGASVFSDLLRTSLQRVDWHEIAASLIEDAVDELS
jgi:hypothetical protein